MAFQEVTKLERKILNAGDLSANSEIIVNPSEINPIYEGTQTFNFISCVNLSGQLLEVETSANEVFFIPSNFSREFESEAFFNFRVKNKDPANVNDGFIEILFKRGFQRVKVV